MKNLISVIPAAIDTKDFDDKIAATDALITSVKADLDADAFALQLEALKIAEEAYSEVNSIYKSLAPKAPTAKRVLQSKASNGNMASKPGSALDAARAGLAKTAG